MEITWLGHACFRLRGREASVVIDPFDKEKGYSSAKVPADIVLVSHPHPGHNGVANVVIGTPKVLDRAGEYEVKGVPITGVQTAHDGAAGRRRGQNIAWLVQLEDVNVCHLGDIGHVL